MLIDGGSLREDAWHMERTGVAAGTRGSAMSQITDGRHSVILQNPCQNQTQE